MNAPLKLGEPKTVAVKTRPVLASKTRRSLWLYGVFVLALSLCFARSLLDLVRLGFSASLYSHLWLVPLISIYMGWLRRESLPLVSKRPSPAAVMPIALGLAGLGAYWLARARGFVFVQDDYLALVIGAFVCLLIGGAILILGLSMARALMFPLGFLVFMIPFPVALAHGIESFFQHASAEATYLFFLISGTPMFRDGLAFQFPGLSIEVAEECSGIRSSLVLFMTSLVAGHMFLSAAWKRTVLALFVIPLAIARNAFRIFTIVMLTLHVNPNAIHSPIHTRGGPLFFLLSLVPFFLLLVWLRRSEVADEPSSAMAKR